MDMCILDSGLSAEPGRFVFDKSYLNLKITGTREELIFLRDLSRGIVFSRAISGGFLLYGSREEFKIFLEKKYASLDKSFRIKLKVLIELNSDEIKLPNSGSLSFVKPLIMGVINVTNDSFYINSQTPNLKMAMTKVKQMLSEGADIIDIGGESSRPGSKPVEPDIEISRIIPLIKGIREFSKVPISIDTYRKDTAEKAIEAGADIINDISALTFDNQMAVYAALNDVPVILMHMKGKPATMQSDPFYSNVIEALYEFFTGRIKFAEKRGMNIKNLILDPGIGFGKRLEDNLTILKNIEIFKKFRLPLMLGTSRKSFIGEVLNQKNPNERLNGTMGTTALGVLKGVHIFRVHDVRENREIADLVYNIIDI